MARKKSEDDFWIGGTRIRDLDRPSAADAFLRIDGEEIPPGMCRVTITLEYCGGKSTRSAKLSESNLDSGVVRFFDPLMPNDRLIIDPRFWDQLDGAKANES